MGNNKKPSQEGLRGERGDLGKWGSPPEKFWWPPVLLIFYLIMADSFLIVMISKYFNNPKIYHN